MYRSTRDEPSHKSYIEILRHPRSSLPSSSEKLTCYENNVLCISFAFVQHLVVCTDAPVFSIDNFRVVSKLWCKYWSKQTTAVAVRNQCKKTM